MKFPKVIQHRKAEVRIYGRTPGYDHYRLAYHVAGRRKVRSFAVYGDAKREGDRVVRELAKGSQSPAFGSREALDAKTAMERLEEFRRATGRRVSLLAAVTEFAEASLKLGGQTLAEAVTVYLRTVAAVQRKDVSEAVEEFLKSRQPLARVGANGERAQLSSKYAYNLEIQLRRFAGAFPGSAVCDLTKLHLDQFVNALEDFSAKSRNHYRAAVRQFLQWAMRKDFLSPNNRLGEADGLRPERANHAEVAFYKPAELRTLLDAAEKPMRVMIALGALAGLRTSELLLLGWDDVWRVPGHIEVTSSKSKTRQRRLITVVPALAAWLNDFRGHTAGRVWEWHEITFQEHVRDLCEATGVTRKKNGLRHSYTLIQKRHLETVNELNSVTSSIDNLKACETGLSQLKIDQEVLQQKARRDYDERREIWEKAIELFNTFTERLYNAPGRLVIDVTPTGFKFDVEIERSGSSGVGNMKVFCYDMTIASLWAEKSPSPKLVVHDSAIFDGVDERQRALALEVAANEAEARQFQYICTLNSDEVPWSEFSEGFDLRSFVKATLTDATVSGSLLGLRF